MKHVKTRDQTMEYHGYERSLLGGYSGYYPGELLHKARHVQSFKVVLSVDQNSDFHDSFAWTKLAGLKRETE